MESSIGLILIFFSALTSRAATENEAYSTRGIYFANLKVDSILKGYVIERATVASTVECGLKCQSLLPDCKSFNYIENSSETAICEINNSSKSLAKKNDFVCQARSQYFEPVADEKSPQVPQDISWTLVARFSNNDSKRWMEDHGTWWYDRVKPYGKPLDPGDNADMISEAFWLMNGTEFKITRSDDSTHTALLTTTGNCLEGKTFRSKMASFGTFRGTTSWASPSSCRGSCFVSYGGLYTTTAGFGQSQCDGDIQSKNSIGFWCRYSDADGSVLMIGGGGDKCNQAADHGIGITKANNATFDHTQQSEYDFGNVADVTPLNEYSLNLWVRQGA